MTDQAPDNIDPTASEDDPLDGVMQDLAETVDQADEGVSLGDAVELLGSRGFGPMLLIASAMMMLPIANIPFLPAIMGLVIGGIGIQFLRGVSQIWIPRRLRRLEVPKKRMSGTLEKVQSGLDKVRPLLARRLTVLVDARWSLIAIGIILLVTAAIIVSIGAVPMLPATMSVHVLLFGIGMSSRDGLFVLAGYVWLLPACYLAWMMGSGLFGA